MFKLYLFNVHYNATASGLLSDKKKTNCFRITSLCIQPSSSSSSSSCLTTGTPAGVNNDNTMVNDTLEVKLIDPDLKQLERYRG